MEPKEILVRINSRKKAVPADDVYYIESSNRKVILYMKDGIMEYYDKIGGLEELLRPEFFRIHKGYLVNMKYVRQHSRTEVSMENGDRLPISKYKYQDFARAYGNYISEIM